MPWHGIFSVKLLFAGCKRTPCTKWWRCRHSKCERIQNRMLEHKMHWSAPVTAIIGFDRVHFAFLAFRRSSCFFSLLFLIFCSVVRNETNRNHHHHHHHCHGYSFARFAKWFISFAHSMARNKHSISEPCRTKQHIEWTECAPFHFPSHFHLAMWVWVCANRSSFSFSIKCTSVTFN